MQIFGVDPACPFDVEGMLGCGFNLFAANGEADDGFVGVVDGVGDGKELVGYFYGAI